MFRSPPSRKESTSIYPSADQIDVNQVNEGDYSVVLRAFLDRDPDIIGCGEMSDDDTARACIEAALNGHTVLAAMPTNDAVETLIRLTEMNIPPSVSSRADPRRSSDRWRFAPA